MDVDQIDQQIRASTNRRLKMTSSFGSSRGYPGMLYVLVRNGRLNVAQLGECTNVLERQAPAWHRVAEL